MQNYGTTENNCDLHELCENFNEILVKNELLKFTQRLLRERKFIQCN